VLDALQYAQYNKERVEELNAYSNQNNAVPQIYLDVLNNPEAYNNSPTWQDYVFREGTDAMIHDHNLTIKAGNDKLRAIVAGGYQKQNGIMPNTDFQRLSFRTNIISEITSWLKSTASLSVAHTEDNSIPETGARGIVMKALTTSPLQSPYDENGKIRPYIPADSPGYFSHPNPLFEASEIVNNTVGKDINATFGLDLQIVEGLHYKPQFYTRLYSQENNSFTPSTIGIYQIGSATNLSPGAPPFVNSAQNQNRNLTNWGIDNLLTYSKTMGDHSIGALLGYTAQKESGEVAQITGSGFPTDNKINYLEATETSVSVSDLSNWALNAVFFRLNYDYKAKYLVEVNFRREGSSKFGTNNKYGNFPSTSVGWRVSEEKFYPKDFFMNELKLRASYGITGNSSIGDFDRFGRLVSIPDLNNVSNNFNYVLNNNIVVGKTLITLGNQDLKWETSTQLDVGFNAGLFNDRLTVSAGYFKKTTEDMLFNVSIPNASGFSSTRDNVGEMVNQGWDIEIGANLASKDFSWSSSFSLSVMENEVTNMPEEISKIVSGKNVTQVGYAVGSLYGYVIDGIFNTQEQVNDPNLFGYPGAKKLGAYIYKDVNGDKKIDGRDMDVIGNPHPKVQLGFNNSFNYKNFSLSILTTGAFGYDILPQANETLYNGKGRWNVSTKFLERWTSPSSTGAGLIPQIPHPGTHFASNLWVENGNHIWIKNITLGYRVPQEILNKTKVISALRFYCSVQNAFKITDYSGPNPQVSSHGGGFNPQQFGIDDFSYPVNRTISFGANIKF
jgi:TonB-linked SusC/RagA family outer membrane protein